MTDTNQIDWIFPNSQWYRFGLEQEGTAAVVQKALLQLDADDRAIVILREIEERSYGEIGAVLGLPEGTVKSRLFRARAKLKLLLDKVSA